MAAAFAGCAATTPSSEAKDAALAMAASSGVAAGEPCEETDIEKVCNTLDGAFTKDELIDLRNIFSDAKVRELMQAFPVDATLLDARIRELATTDAILKFQDDGLQRAIFINR